MLLNINITKWKNCIIIIISHSQLQLPLEEAEKLQSNDIYIAI